MIENLRVSWISAETPFEAVANAVITAIEKRKLDVVLPFNARLLCYANALFPRLADWATRILNLQGWEMPSDPGG